MKLFNKAPILHKVTVVDAITCMGKAHTLKSRRLTKKSICLALAILAMATMSWSYAEPASVLATSSTQKSEHVVWGKRPITVTLPVGTERMVSFPGPVEFINHNATLTTDNLRVINNAGTLYLLAKKSFSPVRVEVQLISSGEIILMDVSAQAQADGTTLDVVLAPKSAPTQKGGAPMSNEASAIDLLQFAVQQLYAPERLLNHPLSISRVPMNTHRVVSLFYGGITNAFPIASWSSGDAFVTAVLVKNQSNSKQKLKHSALKGDWVAMAFYPTQTLTPNGTPHDKTTVFLVSHRPFAIAQASFSEGGR